MRYPAIILLLLWTAAPAFAHRLDEFLQATTIRLQKDRVVVDLRLTPGVDVSARVVADIDTDGNKIFSEREQQGYATRVSRDLSLSFDGKPLPLQLASSAFPTVDEINGGLGDIVLTFEAAVPAGAADHQLTFENHHEAKVAAYLVNVLVPSDPDIHVLLQDRSYDQSIYRLQYTQSGAIASPADASNWLDRTGSRSLFTAYLYHGVRHILTGYDHLLFVSALVLAATTLWDLIKVVTAFTLAHTLTLTLAALDVVHVSSHVVEPLIAASIVFVALQNVFWPKQARGYGRIAAAAFFGLFHGLGFAGGLLDAMRQMQGGTMFLAIVAFSIGVEAGHQMIVLPLFAMLKGVRSTQADVVTRARLAMALQRFGSAAISTAGMYYLWIALATR